MLPNNSVNLDKLCLALNSIRTSINIKAIPLYWVEFLLIVAKSGDKGITTMEVCKELGMTQGIASRLVKMMSLHLDSKTKEIKGNDLLQTEQDLEFPHRQRVLLSAKGKQIIDNALSFLK